MRRLTALVTAALLMAGGYATTAPGQLGEAARVPVWQADALPLADTPPAGTAEGGAFGPGRQERFPGANGAKVAGRVVARTGLRASPGGRLVTGIGPRTRFGGPQILAVVARRGRWAGVLHPWMPNGKAGWVDLEDLELVTVAWEIEIDRSARIARVRHRGELVQRFPVSVGRPTSPTPVGRFAVTDRLAAQPGSPYGCCILALSATQDYLPTGWTGGDRIALHGSPDDGTGAATSSGCVRVREKDLRRLMKRIPLGTRVTVKA